MLITPRVMLHALFLVPVFAALPGAVYGADNIREVLCTREYASNMRTKTMFQKIDLNNDGQVTHDEIAGYFGKLFDALDVDHNGLLDDNEWIGARTNVSVINYSTLAYAEQLATDRMMRLMDRENHKVVTKEAFISQHEKMFDAMTNGHNEPLDTEHWLAAYFPK